MELNHLKVILTLEKHSVGLVRIHFFYMHNTHLSIIFCEFHSLLLFFLYISNMSRNICEPLKTFMSQYTT